MSWELHVTRRESWTDTGSDISLEEWKAYVAASSDMRLDGHAESAGLKLANPGIAVWTGHSQNGIDGYTGWIYQNDGEITATAPDTETFRKLLEIATHFNATVQSDDGEVLDEHTNY